MTAAAIRDRLYDYIKVADDKKIKAIYMMLEDVKVFPYLIINRIHRRKKVVAVSSIFHTSRYPRKKYTK